MMLYCSFFVWLVRVFLVVGCLLSPLAIAAGSASVGLAKPLVVTSIKPLTLIAAEVAGDLVDLQQLLRDGEVPHHFAMRLSQQRLIEDADVLLWVGEDLETPLLKPIRRVDKAGKVITASKLPGISDSPRIAADLHLWLSPDNGLAIARQMAAKLVERYPVIAPQLKANLERLNQRIDRFKEVTRETYQSRQINYVAEHDAYGFFTDRFPSVNLLGALHDQAGVKIGPRELARLYRQQQVSCVVAETPQPSKLLQRLAEQLGVTVVFIDPLGSSVAVEAGGYVQLLQAVAKGFSACGFQA